VTGGRHRRRRRADLVPLLLALLTVTGCGPAAQRAASPATAPPTPASADELEELVVTSVPSGLPRMPDDELQPPAGEKNLSDVASYAGDPRRERQVLQRYGYRFGWERFWGRGAAQTSVFVDQFRRATGASTFTADLARNDATHYRATPHAGTGGLPTGCRLLTVARPAPGVGLDGPAAFAWCSRAVFSVAVTAVSDTPAHALGEVSTVVRAQLGRLG
jgi:hypothetical protein